MWHQMTCLGRDLTDPLILISEEQVRTNFIVDNCTALWIAGLKVQWELMREILEYR